MNPLLFFLDFWLDSFVSGPSPRKMLCCFYGIHNKPKFAQDLIIPLSLYACDLVTLCWHCALILAHEHHKLPRKHGQPLEFSSKWTPWRHKSCSNGTLGVLHAASIYLVENEELKDSTRCNLVGEVWMINAPLSYFWHKTIFHQGTASFAEFSLCIFQCQSLKSWCRYLKQ